jgi:hypothetical protein
MAAHEQAISLAINDYTTGVFPSIRAAAKEYGLPESTLRNRLNG